MMLAVVPIIERLVPGLLHGGRPSVACVCTTRPKFLVFDGDATRPTCVVEFGEAARLTRTARILAELHARLPDRVAGSLCCTSWNNGTHVHIQQGLKGVPWFRLGDGRSTPAAWRSLLTRAVKTMIELHAATRETPAWTGDVNVGAELRHQAERCVLNGTPLPLAVQRRIEEWSAALDRVGPVAACWQHGDFSLNNLLVSDDAIAVIDFEEFGGTMVPLHDAFGLALSVPLSQNGECPLSLADCIDLSVRPVLADERVEPAAVAPLLMHHLLWRVNQSQGFDRRTPLRHVLLGWVDELVLRPHRLLPEFCEGITR